MSQGARLEGGQRKSLDSGQKDVGWAVSLRDVCSWSCWTVEGSWHQAVLTLWGPTGVVSRSQEPGAPPA